MEQRMSIIALGVSDLKQSRAFYENLGWKVATEEQAENIVAFNLQSFVLALYPKKGLADDVGIEMNLSSTPSFTLAYNVSSETEVERIIDEVREIGAKIVKEPQKVFWGGYSSYFSDPDGYLWEVAFNPYSAPEEDGSFKWV
jgi:predicted lactoylglutathione lyase